MPYPVPFVRFKMNGHFGSSGTDKKEYWSAGLNIANPTGFTPTGTTLTNFLTAVATPVTAFHSSSTVNAGAICFLDTLTAALIGTDGRYAGGAAQSTTIYTYATPVAGVGAAAGPWSQAMAWSLRSAILRGPGSHGRCFYPATAINVTAATGTLSTVAQSNYLAVVLILINAINAAAVLNLATGSNVSNVSPIGGGQRSPVTRVGIGARLDTQESREKGLSEAYVFGNTVVAARVLEDAERDYLELLKTLPDFKE